VIAVLAMLLPGTDPITDGGLDGAAGAALRGSILFAALLDRRSARERERAKAEEASASSTRWPSKTTTRADVQPLRRQGLRLNQMLFDLRSPGRRNAIKVVYVTLALLMGGGLVLFGIGGEVSGGVVDALTGSNRGDDGSDRFASARSRR
jgi:hypothetical protein